jgi:hypothetical protein
MKHLYNSSVYKECYKVLCKQQKIGKVINIKFLHKDTHLVANVMWYNVVISSNQIYLKKIINKVSNYTSINKMEDI